jgi:hypothetical protein
VTVVGPPPRDLTPGRRVVRLAVGRRGHRSVPRQIDAALRLDPASHAADVRVVVGAHTAMEAGSGGQQAEQAPFGWQRGVEIVEAHQRRAARVAIAGPSCRARDDQIVAERLDLGDGSTFDPEHALVGVQTESDFRHGRSDANQCLLVVRDQPHGRHVGDRLRQQAVGDIQTVAERRVRMRAALVGANAEPRRRGVVSDQHFEGVRPAMRGVHDEPIGDQNAGARLQGDDALPITLRHSRAGIDR